MRRLAAGAMPRFLLAIGEAAASRHPARRRFPDLGRPEAAASKLQSFPANCFLICLWQI
jgi:hypothetical protein